MIKPLPPRQREVARLIASCRTVKQIAADMQIDRSTVHEYISRIVVTWNLDPSRDVMTQIALTYTTATAA